MVNGSNGVAQTTLPVGQHSYIVACNGYESEEGMVKLKASAPSNLQITLSKEAMATQQSTVTQPAVAQRHVVQAPVTNGDNISIPVKNGVRIDMVRIEAGTFTMGATSEMKDPWDDEKPTHQVTLTNDYYIGKYEVTQALWKAVMGNKPSKFKGDNLPVENVSWKDCQEFISKLNSITGKTFRLPTEAEWEYAARGGNKSQGYQYSGSNNLFDVAWYEDNSGKKTHAVGTKQPNELGIYDMSGNVWEWCQDWFGEYSSSSQTNPTGANSGSYRVKRGGGWGNTARLCRSSCRVINTPGDRDCNLGLRLILSE
ncbi:formylglycine-generating enzyme family protein [Prevotella hominis]|nr:formylglycine-generating enzyme family protein [Segatella hominis]